MKDSTTMTLFGKIPLQKVHLTAVVVLFLLTISFGVTLVTTLHSIVNYQTNSAKYINVSGQQRMLSQRLALFSLMYSKSGEEDHREQVQLALKKITYNLNYLLDESREHVMMSEALFDMYYRPPLEVRTSLKQYLAAVNAVIAVPPEQLNTTDLNAEIQYILANVTPLLNKLDTVVHQYELEAIKTVERLSTLELVLKVSFILCSGIILFVYIVPWFMKIRAKHAHLHAAASSDHLTKLLNRNALSELGESIFQDSHNSAGQLSALIIDIDYFKQVNDTYGHAAGDKVLVKVSDLICDGLRENDYCFRYGGEEFLVLLPQTNMEQAIIVAEKIREQIKATELQVDDTTLNVTLSIGVSIKHSKDRNLNDLIERADISMYRAKNQGRDRIIY